MMLGNLQCSNTNSLQEKDTPFSFNHLYAFPENIAQYDQHGPRKKIAIVGAGIAGLIAGYELKKQGHQVHIFEASNRLGGRIHTHFFSDGNYGELGASRVPVSHRCVLHYIEAFGLKTRPFISYNENAYYYVRGTKTRIRNWRSLLEKFTLLPNEQKPPRALYGKILQESFDNLSDAEKWNIFSSTLNSPLLKKYEEQSLWQYLSARLSDEAIDYIAATTGMLHQKKASFLAILLDHFSVLHGEKLDIIGGFSELVKALANTLKGHISCNATVKKIQLEETATHLYWNQLGLLNKEERFDYVIVTVPLPALLKIDFHPRLSVQKQEAIRGISYESAGKMLFHVRKRPWEFKDRIYGGSSYSDLSFQQCWYPSDNVMIEKSGQYSNGKEGHQPYNDRATVRIKAKNTALSHEPAVLTASYVWGDNALRFAALSEQERIEMVLRDLRHIHPGIENYIEDAVSMAWDSRSPLGCGGHAFFSPGEHKKYQQIMCAPYPKTRPRVFFAGEHLGIIHGCMQGAIQTALKATEEVLKAAVPEDIGVEK